METAPPDVEKKRAREGESGREKKEKSEEKESKTKLQTSTTAWKGARLSFYVVGSWGIVWCRILGF